jgi:hypothetical protein
MPIWKTTSIEETPEIRLLDWQIFELEDGSKHFMGYNITEREGRVSSAIVEFDEETMIGRTKSGRTYQLLGGPGTNSDALYVLVRWLEINGVTKYKMNDVWIDYPSKF